jgi:hypothetical protein
MREAALISGHYPPFLCAGGWLEETKRLTVQLVEPLLRDCSHGEVGLGEEGEERKVRWWTLIALVFVFEAPPALGNLEVQQAASSSSTAASKQASKQASRRKTAVLPLFAPRSAAQRNATQRTADPRSD